MCPKSLCLIGFLLPWWFSPQRGRGAAEGEAEREATPARVQHHPEDLRRDGAAVWRQDGADLRGYRGTLELQAAGRVLEPRGQPPAGARLGAGRRGGSVHGEPLAVRGSVAGHGQDRHRSGTH